MAKKFSPRSKGIVARGAAPAGGKPAFLAAKAPSPAPRGARMPPPNPKGRRFGKQAY